MIVALWFITSGNFKVKESHHLHVINKTKLETDNRKLKLITIAIRGTFICVFEKHFSLISRSYDTKKGFDQPSFIARISR